MIVGLDHITVAVADLDAGVEQYRRVLGCEPSRLLDRPEEGFRAALFDLPDGSMIEVLMPTADDSPWAKRIAERGEGIYLVSFAVEHLAETVAGMQARGVALRTPVMSISVISPKAAGGALLSLTERRS